MKETSVISCTAYEILDSRATPTLKAEVILADGSHGSAAAPSGASTGIFEAHEKRDGDPQRYGGKGVIDAVRSVNTIISPALAGVDACDQYAIDRLMLELDGTESKEKLGANAILAVSLAAANAAAAHFSMPLYRYLGGAAARRLPVPMLNILNGGAHASNNIEIQEFMIMPTDFPSFSEALRAAVEIYHTLGKLLRSRGLSTAVGDEGGFAPDLPDDDAALELICEAVIKAGYDTDRVGIALDAASGEWYDEKEGIYRMPKRGKLYDRAELCDYWETLSRRFPIKSLEDGIDQRDLDGWSELTRRLGEKLMLVGDDLFVTNTARLMQGIKKGAANAVLVKPNQIGTLSETLELIAAAREVGYSYILSHRSGETEDTALADIAVAVSSPFIKTGAPCRGERTAKYNRLLAIEAELGGAADFGSVLR